MRKNNFSLILSAYTNTTRIFFVCLFAILLQQPLFAQIKWPTITQINKPWTRWWWLGSEVNNKDLTTVMQQYQQAGLGGLELTPIYGVKGESDKYIPFLSKQWMGVFDHTLAEGKRLGLGIDLANATGWPFGGPWIGDEDASKNMQYKVYALQSGETLKEKIQFLQEPLVRTENYLPRKIEDIKQPLSANDLQALALDQVRFSRLLPLQKLMAYSNGENPIDLTSKVTADGQLNWVAPKGNWSIYAVFMGWHGKQVERAAPGGEGYVIDHFSATALQHYLQKFDTAFKGHDLTNLRSFFNDSYEVDDARGQSNFTPTLFEEFLKRRGYDLANELPALFSKEKSEKNNRVLCDYRMTIDELILEKFTGEWQKWAHSKNKMVRNQSHGSPANTLDLYGVVDIPETEGTEILRIKFAASTAHVLGKPLASAESATWLNEHFVSTLSDVKKALDTYFIGGVNHIFYHGTSYSPPSAVWPGHLFYAAVEFTQANPFWNNFAALNHYVARTQSFLQAGKPDNDVLLYFPIYDKYSEAGKELLLHFDGMKPEFNGTPFEISASHLQEKGYAFDYISDRQILQLGTEKNQIITGGTSYQTLLIPAAKYMPLTSLQKLVALANEGATILFYTHLPATIPGYGHLAENQAAFNQWRQSLNFEFLPNSFVKKAVVGKGSILICDNLEPLLNAAAIRKESMVEAGLSFNRRKFIGGHTYFIANRSGKPLEGWFPIAVADANASLFNPMNDMLGAALTRKNKQGNLEVYLQFKTDESYILQTNNATPVAAVYPYFSVEKNTAEIIGNDWVVSFVSGGPSLPKPLHLNQLQDWTAFDSSYQIFSGTASYATHFKNPNTKSTQYLLALGKVYESAEVWLNHKKMATLIGPDFEMVIQSKDLLADNLLEIKVANSMANRIIDLEKLKVIWKKFNNTNYPSRLPQNRGADGMFTAANWLPKISGLTGPVSLTAVHSLNIVK